MRFYVKFNCQLPDCFKVAATEGGREFSEAKILSVPLSASQKTNCLYITTTKWLMLLRKTKQG
jgi:hypothetical protein